MSNNNLPPTPTTSVPYSVPRIEMIATYSQSTQTRITSTINNYMQTDTFTLNTSATQTRPFQSNQTTQTYLQQNTQAIQTDLGLNGNLTLDSTDSSTSTDVYDGNVSINNLSSNTKRKSNKDQHSTKRSQTNKKAGNFYPSSTKLFRTFEQNKSNVRKLVPYLKLTEQQLQTFQSSQTFGTLDANCNQSLVQSTFLS